MTDGENLYRHKDARYFLPSEDEWYKAAYHQNDGVTANYWDYATGSNTVPTAAASGTTLGTAIYDQNFFAGPADVNLAGGLSPYGTMGQNGNVWEWCESAFDGSNSEGSLNRALRGGGWNFDESFLRSTVPFPVDPASESSGNGFRVASVSESSHSPPDNSASPLDNSAEKSSLNKKIKKLNKQIKKARKKGQRSKVKRLSKKLKKRKKQLRRL